MTTKFKKGDLVCGTYDGSSVYLLGDSLFKDQRLWTDNGYETKSVEIFTARNIIDRRGRIVKKGSYCNNICPENQGWILVTPEIMDERFKKEAEALEAKYAFVQGFLNK